MDSESVENGRAGICNKFHKKSQRLGHESTHTTFAGHDREGRPPLATVALLTCPGQQRARAPLPPSFHLTGHTAGLLPLPALYS